MFLCGGFPTESQKYIANLLILTNKLTQCDPPLS